MEPNAVLVTLLLVAATAVASEPAARVAPADPAAASAGIANPAIDMPGFLDASEKASAHRRTHRISEEEFLRMSAEPGTIVLDARSAARYAQLHVKGAINLSFPDIAVDSLASTIPDKSTRILIYCNNNFLFAEAFPAKIASASLNLSTFVSLYDYGYRNVYELGPQIDIKKSNLPFEGSTVDAATGAIAASPRL